MHRPRVSGGPGVTGLGVGGYVGVFNDLPHVGEFLTSVTWDDGTPRVPGSIIVFAEDGRVKACLNDKDACAVAFVTGGSLPDLVRVIEEQLEGGLLDWRGSKKPRK